MVQSIFGASRRLCAALLLCGAVSLTACAGGSGSQPSNPAANTAPTIIGKPSTTVQVNAPYQFAPTAYDAEGDPLKWAIQGKPNWATFNTSTGRLYGTPPAGTSGTFVNIQISVTDGKATATLPNFSIAVVAAAPTPGVAELSWSKPTQNVDGTPLTNLAGYRIYYGQSPGSLAKMLDIPSAATQSVVISNLAAGTWYFAMSVYTTGGTESVWTAPVSKSI